MTRQEREIVNRMVDALLDVSSERRAAALEALCEGIEDRSAVPVIRAEVLRLLDEDAALTEKLALLRPTSAAPASAEDSTDLDSAPPIIGRYHIRGRIGRGGMGEVFLADQRVPIRRQVAIKVIRPGLDSRDIVARFDAERQALSRMDHPNIARVLDAGVSDEGRPFVVMEYVPGRPITSFCDELKLSIRERLELFVLVCDAVSYAHTKGLIHRDLKPSNVLATLDTRGERSVKVIDFGIAKAISGDDAWRTGQTTAPATALTETGAVVGTHEYMSPEQAAMSGDIDTRSDVYSLGVVLYELITGRRPFERAREGKTLPVDEFRRLVKEVDPQRPSAAVRATTLTGVRAQELAAARATDPEQWAKTLKRELEWIPLKALRKDPSRRYASPAEMAADIRNYLNDRPLLAAPESGFYRARKFASRHRGPIGVSALLLLLLVGGVIGTTAGMIRADSARQQAETARRLADESGRRAIWSAYRSAIVAAEVALKSGDAIRLRQALDTAPEALRGWEWRYYDNAADAVIAELKRSPSDRFFATIALSDNRRALSGTVDRNSGTVVLWDLQTGDVLRRESGVYFAATPDAKSLAIVRLNGSLDLCELETGAVRWSVPAVAANRPWQVLENCFSADGKLLAAWNGEASMLTLIDVASGAPRAIAVPMQITRLIGFIPLGDGQPERVVFESTVSAGLFSLDVETSVTRREAGANVTIGRHALRDTGPNDWMVVTAPGERNPEYSFGDTGLSLWSSVYLRDRELIASGRVNGSIDVLAPRRGTGRQPRERDEPIRKIVGGTRAVRSLTATPDETRFIVTLENGDVCVVPVDAAPIVDVPMRPVETIAISPQGDRIVAAGWGDVRCVEMTTGLPLWGRNLGPAFNRSVAWSPDGGTVVVVSRAAESGQCDVFVLDGATGEQRAAWCASAVTIDPLRAGKSPSWAKNVAGLAFSADGASLIVMHEDGGITLVDAKTFETRSELAGSATEWSPTVVMSDPQRATLQRSPDGSLIAHVQTRPDPAGVGVGKVVLRDGNTGASVRQVGPDGSGATAVAWSLDGRTLAIALWRAGESRVALVEANSGRVLMDAPAGSGDSIACLTLVDAPDRVVAFTRRGRMIVLDVATREEAMSSFVALPAWNAFTTRDGAVAIAGGATMLHRLESNLGNQTLPAGFADMWPASVPVPRTFVEARRLVSEAHALLQASSQSDQPLEAFLASHSESPAAELARQLADRVPPSINWLNSSALSIMLSNTGNLAQAEAMLKRSVAIKPHSASLQANLGAVLFMRERWRECIGPLRESEALRVQRGVPPSPIVWLRLAIAEAQVGDPTARETAKRAIAIAEEQSATASPDVRPLYDRVRAFQQK